MPMRRRNGCANLPKIRKSLLPGSSSQSNRLERATSTDLTRPGRLSRSLRYTRSMTVVIQREQPFP